MAGVCIFHQCEQIRQEKLDTVWPRGGDLKNYRRYLYYLFRILFVYLLIENNKYTRNKGDGKTRGTTRTRKSVRAHMRFGACAADDQFSVVLITKYLRNFMFM